MLVQPRLKNLHRVNVNSEFDDIYSLPLFSDADRDLLRDSREIIRELRFPQPSGDGHDALKQSLKILADAGLLDYGVAEKGKHLGLTSFALIRETIAYHSVIGDLAFVMQTLGSLPVQLAGSDELKSEYLTQVTKGEAIAAFALSEAGAGSDVAALEATAKKKDNSYIINGNKRLISNAGAATHYSVFARTSEGPKGISAFLVPADSAGLTVRQTSVMTPHPLGSLEFKDVEVNESQRLGNEGEGLKLALKTLARCRPSVGAAACGFARRALEEAMCHVSNRKAFGGVLADQQLVQSMVANSAAELDASRLLVYRATKAFDADPDARHDRSSATGKWFATEAAQRIIDRSQQLAGGIGVLDNCILSELYRAIRPLRIYEGASEVQQLVIARSLMEK